LAPRGAAPQSRNKEEAFRAILQCLNEIQPPGTMWCGRPPLLSDILLGALQEESRVALRSAKPTDRYLLSRGGPVAKGLATSGKLEALVMSNFSGVAPTGVASYIYYNKPGHGLDPHVDTEVYSVNVILMLEHSYKKNPSHLLVYENDIFPKRILLREGEMAIINAGSVIHAREDVGSDERVSILTIGFQYEGV